MERFLKKWFHNWFEFWLQRVKRNQKSQAHCNYYYHHNSFVSWGSPFIIFYPQLFPPLTLSITFCASALVHHRSESGMGYVVSMRPHRKIMYAQASLILTLVLLCYVPAKLDYNSIRFKFARSNKDWDFNAVCETRPSCLLRICNLISHYPA